MKCPIESRESEILLEYSSGKLNAGRIPLLTSHLESCPACREFVRAQRAVWVELDAWQAAPVSQDFDRRLYQRIDTQVSWFQRLMHRLQSVGWRPALPLAASAAVVLMAGFLIQNSTVAPVVPKRDMAQVDQIQPDQLERALDEMDALSQLSSPVPNGDSKM